MTMLHDEIAVCERRIAEEEKLGAKAASPEDAAAHFQLALLYKAQLRVLLRTRGRIPNEAADPIAA